MALKVPVLKAHTLFVEFAIDLSNEKPFRGVMESLSEDRFMVSASGSPPAGRPFQFRISSGNNYVLMGTAKIVNKESFGDNQCMYTFQLLQFDKISLLDLEKLFNVRQDTITAWMRLLKE